MSIVSLFGQTSPDYGQSSYYYQSGSGGLQTDPNQAADAAVGLGVLLVAFLTFIAIYVLMGIFLGKIFKKAGIPAWKAWVPFYNSWILLEMGDQPGFWAVLSIIPIVNIVSAIFMYIAMYHVGKKFGKEGAFVLLAIFLPIVWIIWLAVDKTAVWKGVAVESSAVTPAPAPVTTQPQSTPPQETEQPKDDHNSTLPPSTGM